MNYYFSCTNKRSFKKNYELITQLLITVDGGDERPRNKLTRFLMVLLRRLLDLDKVKVLSFAEGDSKLHYVERYHVCENRPLSQGGVIDSHQINAVETDDKGMIDLTKLQQNIEHF